MNKKNLIKAVELFMQIPQDRFDMLSYRRPYKNIIVNNKNKFCETVGCGAGHLTAIIPDTQIVLKRRSIDYLKTSLIYLDLCLDEWRFLFEAEWTKIDNTPRGLCQRIIYLLKNENEIYSQITVEELENIYNRTEYYNIDVEAELIEIKKQLS